MKKKIFLETDRINLDWDFNIPVGAVRKKYVTDNFLSGKIIIVMIMT